MSRSTSTADQQARRRRQCLEVQETSPQSAGGTGICDWFFSQCQSWADGKHERFVSSYREKLLSEARGRVLEIGPGTGINFKYLSPGIEWHGVEPNRHMYPMLQETACAAGIAGSLYPADARQLPFPADHFNVVIGTLVLCSIDRLEHTVREVHRVLRPGGVFHFLEHVGARPGSVRRGLQHLITPCWRVVGGGCRPNKDTLGAIRSVPFSRVDATAFNVPIPIVWPHIAGTAVK